VNVPGNRLERVIPVEEPSPTMLPAERGIITVTECMPCVGGILISSTIAVGATCKPIEEAVLAEAPYEIK
jgi:hypothetical protein